MKKNFHSNGKLLLTAEFLVIDGAKALALPTRFGQNLKVETLPVREIYWESYTRNRKLWFQGKFIINKDTIEEVGNNFAEVSMHYNVTSRLQQIFGVLLELNPDLFKHHGFSFESFLEFPRNWGLGSSSTLIVNLANWAKVNPYTLLERTFGGSGYDIACGSHNAPLLYERTKRESPKILPVEFNPPFKKELFFVHRNEKQNTQDVVSHYKSINSSINKEWITEGSKLTDKFLNCQDLFVFDHLITEHENLLSQVLQMSPIKIERFADYPRAIKSLGAWGGDFMLATGGKEERNYFKKKGYSTILEYDQMVF